MPKSQFQPPALPWGLRNSPPFHQAEHFPEGHIPRKQRFPEGNPTAKPRAKYFLRAVATKFPEEPPELNLSPGWRYPVPLFGRKKRLVDYASCAG